MINAIQKKTGFGGISNALQETAYFSIALLDRRVGCWGGSVYREKFGYSFPVRSLGPRSPRPPSPRFWLPRFPAPDHHV